MRNKTAEQFSQLVFSPSKFFAQVLMEQRVGWAIAFIAITACAVSSFRVLTDTGIPSKSVPYVWMNAFAASAAVAIILNWIYAFVISALGRKFGGKATAIRVFIVGAYSMAPFVLLSSNFTALFGIIWSFVLAVIGLKLAHDVSYRIASVLQAGFAATLTLIVALILYFAANALKAHHPVESLMRKAAPDIVLKRFDGKEERLSDLKGKVVLLDFWASWCPPCRAVMPTLSALSKEYADRGLVVYGIADDDPKVAKTFLADSKFNIIGVLGSEEIDKSYKVDSLPETLIIDKNGVVQAVHVGVAPDEEVRLRRNIERCLNAQN